MPDQRTTEYYRNREASERAAAGRALNPLVAKVHIELADQYNVIARGDETISQLMASRNPTYIIAEDDGLSDM